jgi:hypothetical protein
MFPTGPGRRRGEGWRGPLHAGARHARSQAHIFVIVNRVGVVSGDPHAFRIQR